MLTICIQLHFIIFIITNAHTLADNKIIVNAMRTYANSYSA